MTGAVSVLSAAKVYCRGTMNRRSAVAALVSLVVTMPLPAWAQGNGKGNGNGGGNGNGNSSSGNNGSGNGNSGDGGNGNGNGNGGGGNSTNGNGGNAETGSDSGTIATETPTLEGSSPVENVVPSGQGGAQSSPELSQDEVLSAVEGGSAVSLQSILPDLRSRTGGEIINAKLQRVDGFLLYAITVLSPDGKVSTEYYYARSGQHVGN